MTNYLSTTEINKQIFFFFSFFKGIFSNADFENLVIFILGLLQDSKHKKITDIARLCDNLKDHSVLSKFLSSPRFLTHEIKERMRKLFLQLADLSKPIFLYIDDTLAEKAGKKVRADWNYWVSKSTFLWSNCFISALIKCGDLEFPFEFKKYYQKRGEKDKSYRPKHKLAYDIIKKAVAWLGFSIYVLFDSWYASADVLNKLDKEKIKFITRLKSNRKVLLGYCEMSLREYGENVKSEEFIETKIKEKVYFYFSKMLLINKLNREMKIIIVKESRYSKDMMFLITNTDLSESEIIKNYNDRWEIEQFFDDIKDKLGFDEYQEIKQVAVSRHITLLFLGYFLISVVRNFILNCSSVLFSIGQTLEKIRRGIYEVKSKLLQRLYEKKYDVNLRCERACDR